MTPAPSVRRQWTMTLGIRTTAADDQCVIVIAGELDVCTAPELRSELNALIEAGCINMIVDLDDVTFMDSSALGVLIGALRRVRERAGTLRIVCSREEVLGLFRITGLDTVFPIVADLADIRRF